MSDVQVTLHYWWDDPTEEGLWEELRIDGEEVASGRPLQAEDMILALQADGRFDGFNFTCKAEEGQP